MNALMHVLAHSFLFLLPFQSCMYSILLFSFILSNTFGSPPFFFATKHNPHFSNALVIQKIPSFLNPHFSISWSFKMTNSFNTHRVQFPCMLEFDYNSPFSSCCLYQSLSLFHLLITFASAISVPLYLSTTYIFTMFFQSQFNVAILSNPISRTNTHLICNYRSCDSLILVLGTSINY